MRIATWNVNHRRPVVGRPPAVAELERQEVDIALLQEADGDQRWASHQHFAARHIGNGRRWGSGVASNAGPLTPLTTLRKGADTFELHRTFPGSVSVAQLNTTAGPLTLVSLHNLFEHRVCYPTLLRHIADLAPLLDSRHASRLILGGDFNAGALGTVRWATIYEAMWQLLETFGLVDVTRHTANSRPPADGCPCARAPGCGHLSTQRPRRGDHGYQVDHLFVSRALLPKLRGVELGDAGSHPFALSDHRPLIVDIGVTACR